MRMRATEAYFEAKKAEIERMEEMPAGSQTTSPTVSMPSIPPIPPMPVSSIPAPVATSVPPATLATNPLTDCSKEVSIGTEDGILLKCIERYIEEYSDDSDELKPVKHILSEWLGYTFLTDGMRKKIDSLNKIIARKQKENKPSTRIYNNGEYYADNAQKKIYSK